MNIKEKIARDVFYVESIPRLAFTDNMYSITNTVYFMGLKGRYSTSAYYHQGLENLLEAAVERGYKYALAIDYDTWFSEFHVIDLYEIMERHPDLLALFPLQPRRGHIYPIAGTFCDPDGNELKIVKARSLENDIYEADSGHFGLTLIRLSLLKKLSKPWFHGQPNENGSWGNGKKDPDVAFWIKVKQEGFKVAAADVRVGHIQLLCSFTGPKEKNFKTQYVPMQAIFESRMPGWVEPQSSKRERKSYENRTTGNEESGINGTNRRSDKGENQGIWNPVSGGAAAVPKS